MSENRILAWLIIGVVAGWLAGLIVRGRGFGLIGDMVLGVVGAFVGRWLADRFAVHIGSGVVSSIIMAAIGAVILAGFIRLIRRT